MTDDLLGLSVADLVRAMRDRDARLPFEIGTFIALESCEHVLRGPAVVKPTDVRVTDDGVISVYAPAHSAGNAEAARSIGGLLAHLLVAAGSGVPPFLLNLIEQGPSGGRWELGRLRDELEASLVPLNRSAARRVLSRMVRDLQKPPRRASSMPSGPLDMDDDLDALLDGRAPSEESLPTTQMPALDASGNPIVSFADIAAKRAARGIDPPSKPPKPRPTPRAAPPARSDDSLPEIARLSEPGTDPVPAPKISPSSLPPKSVSEAPRPAQLREASEPAPPLSVEAAPEPVSIPPAAPTPRRQPDLDGFEDEIGKKPIAGKIAMLLLLVVVAGAVALVFARPDLVDSLLGREPPPEEPAEDPNALARAREAAEAELRARYGTLTVRTDSTHAQVFLFVGRGPAVADNLPVGVAHELVAIADGHGPTRAVVPASAEWAETDDGPLYELAMQASSDEVAFADLNLGETTLDRDAMGSPSGALGRIRVITNPPGARVFQLVGFGTATIQNLPTDSPREILVFEPGSSIQRAFVGPSDWSEGERGKTAEIHVRPGG